MRFFEQQDRVRSQTRKLLLFALAVLLLVLPINAALALTWRLVTPGFSAYPALSPEPPSAQDELAPTRPGAML
ncbi:MAG: hypothetical protein Q8O29_03710 [Polaromonas sp.]|nr:hypothetical protein [Polaromonas sp.]